MEMSEYLRQKRKNAELSQGAVAKELGYTSPQFISNWGRGISDPPVGSLRKIAQLYRVPIDEMFSTLLEVTIQRTTTDLRIKFDGKKKR